MAKRTIEIPDIVKVHRGGVVCEIESAKLSDNMISNGFVAGMVTKVGDAASGAVGQAWGEANPKGNWEKVKKADKEIWKASHEREHQKISLGNMAEVRTGLYADNWGVTRGPGSGLDPQIIQLLNGELSKSVPGWSKVKIGKQTEARVDLWATFDESKKAKWNAKAAVIKAIKAKAIAEIKALDDKDVPVDLDD